MGELLFQTGRWDDALAEVETRAREPEGHPTVACCNLGIAAVISFHRGETDAARRHLAAAGPHAERLGHRLIGPLALARSLDREQDGALPEALAALTDGFDGNAEELEEIEDLLADAVRLGRRDRRPRDRAGPGGPGRRARRRVGDPAPAGERAVLPRPAGP